VAAYSATYKVVTTILLLLLPINAMAHVALKNSVPEANAQLNQAPKALTLNFDKEVYLMKVTLADATGKPIVLPKLTLKLSAEQVIALPALGAGTYLATWVSMGRDGHNMSGTLSFSVIAGQ